MAVRQSLIQVVLKANDQISTPLKNIERNLGKFGSAFKALSGIAAAAGVVAVTRQLSQVVSASVEAASQQEQVERRLAQALANTGQNVEANLPRLRDLATALQFATGAADDQILSGQALLVTLGKLSGEGLDRATRASLDFAAATGTDLQASFTLLAKAAAGNTAALSRYGIVLDENIPKGERFGAVLRLIDERMGGQAAAAMDTFAGKLTRVGQQFGEIQESLGNLIVNAPAGRALLDELAKALSKISEAISRFDPETFNRAVLASTPVLANFAKAANLAAAGLAAFVTLTLNNAAAGGLTKLREEWVEIAKVWTAANKAIDDLVAGVTAAGAGEKKAPTPFKAVTEDAKEAAKSVKTLAHELQGAASLDDLLRASGVQETGALQDRAAAISDAMAALQAAGAAISDDRRAAIVEGLAEAAKQLEDAGVTVNAFGFEVSEARDRMLSLGEAMQFALADQGLHAVTSISDALIDAAQGAQIKWGEFLRGLISDLAKAAARAAILNAIATATAGASGGWAGAFAQVLGVSNFSTPGSSLSSSGDVTVDALPLLSGAGGQTIVHNWSVLDGASVERVLSAHPREFGRAFRRASEMRTL